MALTDYVIMPGQDYEDACDAIRAKTGKTDLIKSGEMATEIESISGGGGDNIVVALPAGYKVVNCVSIPFGGYVNTLIVPTVNWNDYYLDARFDTPISDINASSMLFGCRSGPSAFAYIGVYSQYNGFVFQLASSSFYELGAKDNNRHVFQAKNGQEFIAVDSMKRYGTDSALDLTSPILIGGRQTADGTGVERNSALTVWRYTHTRGVSKAIDLIPCQRESDGEYGFFDLVSGSFFGNLGTGTFTEGVE